jgi:MFS family permease
MKLSFLPNKNSLSSIEEAQKKMSKESYMILVAVVGSLCAVSQGFIVAQSELLLMDSSFLSLMSDYDNTFVSHFMAIFYTGEMFGAAISFVFSDMFGRNRTLIYFALLSVLMLLWCAATASSGNLLSARFGLGCSMGVMLATAPVYVAEVATTENRGQSIGFLSINIVTGSLLAIVSYYFLQPYDFGWRIALILPVSLLLTQALLLSHLPESPRWLLAKKTPGGNCLSGDMLHG